MLKVIQKYFFTQQIQHCLILIFYIEKKCKYQNVKSILFRSFESMQPNKFQKLYVFLITKNVEGYLLETLRIAYKRSNGNFSQEIYRLQTPKNPQRRCVVCAKHKKRSETTWSVKNILQRYTFQAVLKNITLCKIINRLRTRGF